jgi:NitT/TauT family transport system ATP-binding protein
LSSAGIEVRDLCVEFQRGTRVLDELSLKIAPGEIVGLLGGSGSGKSTLLRTIAGLQAASSGEVRLAGADASGIQSALGKPALAYVFQDPTLLPWRTARQNVALPLQLERRARALDSNEAAHEAAHEAASGDRPAGGSAEAISSAVAGQPTARERVEQALSAVGLPVESRDRYPRQLSGGMRMRVSLARAIVTDPAVLLLDEPFAALDEILRGRMNDLIVELWQRRRRTILFVTHNIAEAINLSQRIAILGTGRVAEWIDNPLPFPRTPAVRTSAAFAEFYARVSAALTATVAAI